MRAHKITTVINLPEYEQIITIEDQIKQYKSLKNQIEILEIQLKQVKEDMLKDYFTKTGIQYKNKFGQVMASRSDYEMSSFNSGEFKKDHEDVYKLYTKKISVTKLIIK